MAVPMGIYARLRQSSSCDTTLRMRTDVIVFCRQVRREVDSVAASHVAVL